MARTETEEAILKTIAYFDLYQYPLTGTEVEKHLFSAPNNCQFIDILRSLDSLVANNTLSENQGFYFFPSNDNYLDQRAERYLQAQKKLAIARRNCRLLSRIPFLKAIFVCNGLSYLNSPTNGDIDFTIITSRNKIWFVRFFAVTLMSILRRRPTAQSHRNKICLSFFIAKNDLNLSKIAYDQDIHFAYWTNQQLPIYGDEATINNFFNANQWARQFLPNFNRIEPNDRIFFKKNYFFKKITEEILAGKIGDWLEKKLKNLQLQLMPSQLLIKEQESNSDVVISNSILKFHVNDSRKEISRLWQEKISQIL